MRKKIQFIHEIELVDGVWIINWVIDKHITYEKLNKKWERVYDYLFTVPSLVSYEYSDWVVKSSKYFSVDLSKLEKGKKYRFEFYIYEIEKNEK